MQPWMRGAGTFRLLPWAVCALAGWPAAWAQVAVEYVQPEPTPLRQQFSLTGTVSTPLDARLSPQISGLVAQVLVDAGDTVEEGQALLRLDSTLAGLALQRQSAAVEEAQARLRDARRLRDEAAPLARKGSLAQSEYASRTAQAEQAAAALARLQAERAEQAERVARHTLRAPFAGVIRARTAAPGEWVATGTPVLALVARAPLRVDLQAPQNRFAQLARLEQARVEIDALPGEAFNGRLLAQVPVVDAATRSFLLRVGLTETAGTRVAPGMSARVSFELPVAATAWRIPAGALTRFPDGSHTVWVIDTDSQAQRRPVSLETQNRDTAVVREGLQAADRVIVQGHKKLQAGQAVSARPHTP